MGRLTPSPMGRNIPRSPDDGAAGESGKPRDRGTRFRRAAARDGQSWIKRCLPRSLLGRSLLIIVTPLVVVQLITGYVFYERHWKNVTRRLALGLAGDIAMIAEHIRTFPGARNEVWILETSRIYTGLNATYRKGEVLPATPPPQGSALIDPVLSAALRDLLRRPFQIDTGKYEKQVEINVQLADGVLQVLASRKRLWDATTYLVILWMVGTSFVLLVIATIFMRNQVMPIKRLAAAAEMFGKGRNVPDFKPAGALEVRQAAVAFNIMRQRIQRQISQRTEMLAGVSHDLRTPLTRMKLELAMLKDTEAAAELQGDLEEMEHMVEAYLAFARGEAEEEPEAIDLSALIEDVARDARRKGAHVETTLPATLPATVRTTGMRRCLTNLIDNAASYGKKVRVEARGRGRSVEITVDDDGPGIPREAREDVFKAFYRIDPSRSPDRAGVGLGMTLARDVVRGHGGEISLADSPQGGLRVSIRLPL